MSLYVNPVRSFHVSVSAFKRPLVDSLQRSPLTGTVQRRHESAPERCMPACIDQPSCQIQTAKQKLTFSLLS